MERKWSCTTPFLSILLLEVLFQFCFIYFANLLGQDVVRDLRVDLLEIGLGKLEVEELHQIIMSKDRSEAGASVPAHGLYLTKVEYPKGIFLD